MKQKYPLKKQQKYIYVDQHAQHLKTYTEIIKQASKTNKKR